ncbi:Hypothetical predicted protein [Octopus vulgaris]|uniref:Uncharacterized protein n=1 Tax=Octopus vulgaris TaxID=6645 RepID=A0AA36FKT4_OCTVU|nr:Hypothetical predicted protein [Octopus vulgaris]
MPPKRPTPSKASGSEPKRQKNVMMFHGKIQLLDMLQGAAAVRAVVLPRRRSGIAEIKALGFSCAHCKRRLLTPSPNSQLRLYKVEVFTVGGT